MKVIVYTRTLSAVSCDDVKQTSDTGRFFKIIQNNGNVTDILIDEILRIRKIT